MALLHSQSAILPFEKCHFVTGKCHLPMQECRMAKTNGGCARCGAPSTLIGAVLILSRNDPNLFKNSPESSNKSS